MFSGTVRTNLDPFGEFGADAILWEALRDVGLEEQVRCCWRCCWCWCCWC